MKTKLAIALLALTQILSWAQITNGGVAVLINRTNRSVLNSGFWPSNAIAMSNALSGIGFTGGGGSFSGSNFNSIVVTNSLQLGVGTNAVTFTSEQNGASASDAAFTFGTVNASTGVFGSFRATSISSGDGYGITNLNLAPALTQKRVWVSDLLGDDATGAANNPNRPFKTLDAAEQAAAVNDIVYVDNGVYLASGLSKQVNWVLSPSTTVTRLVQNASAPIFSSEPNSYITISGGHIYSDTQPVDASASNSRIFIFGSFITPSPDNIAGLFGKWYVDQQNQSDAIEGPPWQALSPTPGSTDPSDTLVIPPGSRDYSAP